MKIFEIIVIILTLISVLLVGTPIEYNCLELNYIIVIIGIVYIIYKIIKKEKIIDKIDIIVLLLCLSSIIPYISNKCINTLETLINIALNMSLFNIYILVKGIDREGKKNIIKTILIGTCVLFLFGIDEMTTKIFTKTYEFLKIPNVINYETRMFSTLGYANSFAILMAISIFLAIGFNKKSIYSGMICLYIIGLILSYSRIVMIFFILIYGIYILMEKKENKMYNICQILINTILAIIYVKIFEKMLSENSYIIIYLGVVIIFSISILLNCILKKQKVIELKNKHILITFLILILLGINIYQIGKMFDKPLEIFHSGGNSNNVRYNIYNIKPNNMYELKFDIDAKSEIETNENYSIEIIEENKYYDTVDTHLIKFNNYTGEKKLEFVTNSETRSITILFKSSNPELQDGVRINSLYINNRKYNLSYMFLPTKLVQRIDNFFNENLSLSTRFTYIKDSIKIIEQNLLTGVGGKGWRYTYIYNQSYAYSSSETHNYLTKIIIENGIFSGILWIILVIIGLKNIIKRYKDNKNLSVDFAFLLLTAHSFLDFDLSFYVINLIWFCLYGMITYGTKAKIEKWIMYIIIIIEIFVLTTSLKYYKIKDENETSEGKIFLFNDNSINSIREIRKTEKNRFFYDELLVLVFGKINDENILYIFKMIKQEKMQIDPIYNIEKNNILYNILKECQNDEIKKEIADYIIYQNEKMIYNIEDEEKNRLSNVKKNSYLNKQKDIYEYAVKIKGGE